MTNSAVAAPRRVPVRPDDAFAALVDDPFQSGLLTGEAVNRSALTVAEIDLATLRVVAVSDAGAALVGLAREQLVGRLISDFVDGDPTGGMPLLATGRLDGFEAPRRIRRVDGTVISAYVWAHVLGLARPARYAAAFVVDSARRAVAVALVVRLGPEGHRHRGRRVADRPDQPGGPERARLPARGPGREAAVVQHQPARPAPGADRPGTRACHRSQAVVRLRVRRADGRWLWCRAHLSAMGEAPRFAFTLRPLSQERIPDAERLSALEGRLAKIAQEVRSVAFPVPSTEAPVLADIPELSNLTSREWQTLSLFADGGRVAGIADQLGLSQSTVRNHLSAIFKKVEVGSQTELLARLRASH